MKNRWKLLGLIPVLVLLFYIAQLGNPGIAIGFGGLIAFLVLVTYATQPKRGQPRQKKPPIRADAELQRWL
ncbi:MAG: hypothetical protein ACRDX9_02920 [Acidimicrobiia bacterium]